MSRRIERLREHFREVPELRKAHRAAADEVESAQQSVKEGTLTHAGLANVERRMISCGRRLDDALDAPAKIVALCNSPALTRRRAAAAATIRGVSAGIDRSARSIKDAGVRLESKERQLAKWDAKTRDIDPTYAGAVKEAEHLRQTIEQDRHVLASMMDQLEQAEEELRAVEREMIGFDPAEIDAAPREPVDPVGFFARDPGGFVVTLGRHRRVRFRPERPVLLTDPREIEQARRSRMLREDVPETETLAAKAVSAVGRAFGRKPVTT